MPLRAYHFSVDDVLESLLEASASGRPLFEHPLFNFLQQLNQRYDAMIDLYLFLQHPVEASRLKLENVSSSLRTYFQQNRWLRLGPHALDRDTPPYAQSISEQEEFCESIYSHIGRFAGPGRSSRWLRLHYFSESFEMASYFRARDVDALLTTDKPAVSYRLPRDHTQQLQHRGNTKFGGLQFVRSHVRIENLVDRFPSDEELACELERLCAGCECAVVFTHEYELVRPEVREMTRRVFSWFCSRNLTAVTNQEAY